jgi:hypothetical protein
MHETNEPITRTVLIKINENISSKHYKGKEMIDNTRNKNNAQNNCHNLFIFHANNNNVGQRYVVNFYQHNKTLTGEKGIQSNIEVDNRCAKS